VLARNKDHTAGSIDCTRKGDSLGRQGKGLGRMRTAVVGDREDRGRLAERRLLEAIEWSLAGVALVVSDCGSRTKMMAKAMSLPEAVVEVRTMQAELGACMDCGGVRMGSMGLDFVRLWNRSLAWDQGPMWSLAAGNAGEQIREQRMAGRIVAAAAGLLGLHVLTVTTVARDAFAPSRFQKTSGGIRVEILVQTGHLTLSWRSWIGGYCTEAAGQGMGTTG
jgi:hypothetical protein